MTKKARMTFPYYAASQSSGSDYLVTVTFEWSFAHDRRLWVGALMLMDNLAVLARLELESSSCARCSASCSPGVGARGSG